MKIVALDIGDAWTGSAISDPTGTIARPYKTVATRDLMTFVQEISQIEKINTVVVGYPKTMRGTESEQTKKIVAITQQLKTNLPQIDFILWDERLSSKRAESSRIGVPSKEEKKEAHSRAAAFILSSYLEYKQLHAG